MQLLWIINSNSEIEKLEQLEITGNTLTLKPSINPLPHFCPPGILLKINFRYVPDEASSTERTPQDSVVVMGLTFLFAEISMADIYPGKFDIIHKWS